MWNKKNVERIMYKKREENGAMTIERKWEKYISYLDVFTYSPFACVVVV